MNTITSTAFRTLVASAVIGAIASSLGSVTNAAELPNPPQAVVKFGDLNISTAQGAAALYGRIRSAAGGVCWRLYDSDDLAYRLNKDTCLQRVIGDAVMKVNRPALTAVYEAHYGTPQSIIVVATQGR